MADEAAVAAVDVGGRDGAAPRVVERLQQRRRDLPILALLCCPHGTTPRTLLELSA